MATVRPFKGLRPVPLYAARVAARPYDVLSSDEARVEAEGNPCSFLHVCKAEIDLPSEIGIYDERVYQTARQNLRKLIDDGILRQDDRACFYLYAQTMGQHTQYGIVGCVSVEEYRTGAIKRHELTRKDKEDDRTRHVLVTGAQTGPIFLMYHSHTGIDEAVEKIRSDVPTADFVAPDNVRHQFWVVSDNITIKGIESAFQEVPCLYIADGHHRCAGASRAAEDLAAANPAHTGNEEYNYILAVLFPSNQLRIMEYNRLVKDLQGRTTESFLEELRARFSLRQGPGPAHPSTKGECRMYLKGAWHTLTFPRRFLADPDPVKQLDVSILQDQLLEPILGIDDPRRSERIDFVGGIRGIEELQRRVDSGEMAVAFSLFPTSIEELLTVADAGKIMPPKSTWFEPKLRDGMVVHLLS